MNFMEIFQKGIMISTKYKNSRWILNSVTDIDAEANIIEIMLNREYVNSMILKDDVIDIKVNYIDAIYIANGMVFDILLDFPQKVKIKIKNIKKLEDKRQEERFEINLSSVVKGAEFNEADYSIMTNISRSGVGIVSKDNINIGTKVFINVFIEEGNILKLNGMLARKKVTGNNIEYGIMTTPVNEENKSMLERFLGDLEEKEKLMISVIMKIKMKNQE